MGILVRHNIFRNLSTIFTGLCWQLASLNFFQLWWNSNFIQYLLNPIFYMFLTTIDFFHFILHSANKIGETMVPLSHRYGNIRLFQKEISTKTTKNFSVSCSFPDSILPNVRIIFQALNYMCLKQIFFVYAN